MHETSMNKGRNACNVLRNGGFGSGGEEGNRTPDTRIFSPLLYQLSYLAPVRKSEAHFRELRHLCQHRNQADSR
jgi:hypothetical protein